MPNLNPLVLLDILLADWVSPKVRRGLHNLILLIAAVVAIWLAADGDWWQFLIALFGSLYAASNRANTTPYDSDGVSGNESGDEDIQPDRPFDFEGSE